MKKLALRALVFGVALLAPVSMAGAQTHVYQLNNSFADQLGGPSLSGTAGNLSAGGYSFTNNQGLSLSGVFNQGNYATGTYTIVFNSLLTNAASQAFDGYQKLIDFQNRTADAGLYVAADANGGHVDFYQADGTENVGTADGVTSGRYQQMIFTRNGAGYFSAYLNGVYQFGFADTQGEAVFSDPSGIANFFMDDMTPPNQGAEYPTGAVNYLATYDQALCSGNQACNVGQVTATPEPASLVLLGTGLLGVFGVARRRRNKA